LGGFHFVDDGEMAPGSLFVCIAGFVFSATTGQKWEKVCWGIDINFFVAAMGVLLRIFLFSFHTKTSLILGNRSLIYRGGIRRDVVGLLRRDPMSLMCRVETLGPSLWLGQTMA
jgi:hypothetical protein